MEAQIIGLKKTANWSKLITFGTISGFYFESAQWGVQILNPLSQCPWLPSSGL